MGNPFGFSTSMLVYPRAIHYILPVDLMEKDGHRTCKVVAKRFGRRRPFLALGGCVLLLAPVLVGDGGGSKLANPVRIPIHRCPKFSGGWLMNIEGFETTPHFTNR